MKKVEDVSEIVEEAIKKSRLLRMGIIKSSWKKIVGELSGSTKVVFYKKGVLGVLVENSMWLHHLNMKKYELIDRINDYFDEKYVLDIRFKVGKLSLSDFEKEFLVEKEEKELEVESLTLIEIEEIKKITSEIDDEEIRRKTYEVMVKAKKKEKSLIKNGYYKCKSCGTLHKLEGNYCAICLNKKKNRVEEEILKQFSENYELSYEDIQNEYKISPDEFKRIKQKKLTYIQRELEIFVRENKIDLALERANKFLAIEASRDKVEEREALEFVEILKEKSQNYWR